MTRKYEPTEKDRGRVEALAGYGFTIEQISADLRIDHKTLYKYFSLELATAHVRANALVAQSLFRKATGEGTGAVAAAIFWLKVRAGWKENDFYDRMPPAPKIGKKEQALRDAMTPDTNTTFGEMMAERYEDETIN
jgi:hypothetical protein